MAEKKPRSPYDEDNRMLLLYRMEQTERKLDKLTEVIANREMITKTDLNEFRDVLIQRLTEVNGNLQGQIDNLKEDKADKATLEGISRLVWWGLGILGSVLATGIVILLKGSA